MIFWKAKEEDPQDGDFRTVARFVWWPQTLNGITRWLEMVAVFQVYETYYDPHHDEYYAEWVDVCWDDLGSNDPFGG